MASFSSVRVNGGARLASAPKTAVRAGRASVVRVEAHTVAVLGAGGGIGQPLALLAKMLPAVTDLRLYDVAPMAGVAADLSHINTPARVAGFSGPDELAACLAGCEIVVIPAGVPRKPGMTRDDLFAINAGIVKGLAEACAAACPDAQLHIISNPVNSTVPIAAAAFRAAGVFDRRKIMGVTRLDVVRSNTFVAEARGLDVRDVSVPCVGGHAGATILPLLSQASPPAAAAGWAEDAGAARAMTEKIQEAGTVVVQAKDGKGSATLSMAYAAAGFLDAALRALDGEQGVVECAYVATDLVEGSDFFAGRCRLGPAGAEEVLPLETGGAGPLSALEREGVEGLVETLRGNVAKGTAFVTEGQ